MSLDQLIVELLQAQRQAGRMAPVGVRSQKIEYGETRNIAVRVVRPVIVRIEGGNVYLDPEPS